MKQAIAFIVFILATVCINAQQLITLYTNAIELNAASANDIQRIPFSVSSSVDINTLQVQTLGIKLGKRLENKWLNELKVSIVKDGYPAIEIKADLKQLRMTGTYEIYLLLSNGTRSQEITISVTRPAAKIEKPDTVHINLQGKTLRVSDPFRLKESGNLSNIQDLKLAAPLFTGLNTDKLVTFSSKPATINAGTVYHAIYTADKAAISNIPFGKFLGKMEIASPELTAPVVVDFEIVHKRSKWCIFLLLFLGIALGAFFRTYLKNRKETEEKKIEGFTLLNSITRVSNRIADSEFIKEVKRVTEDLEAALAQKSGLSTPWTKKESEALTALIAETETSYKKIKEAFDKKVRDAEDKMKLLALLFAPQNSLNLATKTNLKQADIFYNSAKTALNSGDVTTAENSIGEAVKLLNDLITRCSLFINRVAGFIEAPVPNNFFPSNTPTGLQQAIKDQIVVIKTEIKELKPVGDPKEMENALSTMDSAYSKLLDVLRSLADQIKKIVAKSLDGHQEPEAIRLQTASEKWIANLEGLLTGKIDPLVTFDNVEINKAIGDFKKLDTSEEDRQESVSGDSFDIFDKTGKMFTTGGTGYTLMGYRYGSIETGLKRAKGNWILFAVIQSVFLFLLLSLAAYRLYADSFVGTIDEMIAIFLVAFGMDITVESVYSLRDKKPYP